MMTEPTRMILLVFVAAVLAVAVYAEWTIVGVLLKRSGMPCGPWATGVVCGLLLAVSLGVGLVAAQALGTI